MAKYTKALVALMTAVVVLVNEFGIEVSWANESTINAVAVIVGTILVERLPNREA